MIKLQRGTFHHSELQEFPCFLFYPIGELSDCQWIQWGMLRSYVKFWFLQGDGGEPGIKGKNGNCSSEVSSMNHSVQLKTDRQMR